VWWGGAPAAAGSMFWGNHAHEQHEGAGGGKYFPLFVFLTAFVLVCVVLQLKMI
jgi:hypothetical protein